MLAAFDGRIPPTTSDLLARVATGLYCRRPHYVLCPIRERMT
jgi:hypothetical protein